MHRGGVCGNDTAGGGCCGGGWMPNRSAPIDKGLAMRLKTLIGPRNTTSTPDGLAPPHALLHHEPPTTDCALPDPPDGPHPDSMSPPYPDPLESRPPSPSRRDRRRPSGVLHGLPRPQQALQRQSRHVRIPPRPLRPRPLRRRPRPPRSQGTTPTLSLHSD